MKLIIAFTLGIISTISYPGIIILMAAESAFIPIPSEIVMGFAGYLAFQGKMNLLLIIMSGTLGNMVGAFFIYWISFIYGKKPLLKFGKYVKLTEERYSKIEGYFKKHGQITTFLSRFFPGARQLVSIPAGIVKMNKFKFLLYSFLGALIWNIILTGIGYALGYNLGFVIRIVHLSYIYVVSSTILILIIYIYFYRRRAICKKEKSEE